MPFISAFSQGETVQWRIGQHRGTNDWWLQASLGTPYTTIGDLSREDLRMLYLILRAEFVAPDAATEDDGASQWTDAEAQVLSERPESWTYTPLPPGQL